MRTALSDLPLTGRATGLLKLVSFALLLLACMYLGKGLRSLVLDPRGAIDLNQRFQEMHLFWKMPITEADRSARLDASFTLTRWDSLNYLPSTNVLGFAFTPPLSWTALRWYYAALNLCLIAALTLILFKLAQPASVPVWLFFPWLVASSTFCSALGNGQYGIVVATMLAGAVLAAGRGRWVMAVILLTLAAVKPVLCVPFFLALLFYRQWRLLLWPTVLAGGALAYGFWTSADPLSVHIANYRSSSVLTMTRGYGINNILLGLGLPVASFSLAGLLIAAASLWYLSHLRPQLWQERPLIFLGLACFMCRAWFPLTEYDNVMLLPLFAALLAEAGRKGPSAATGLACLFGVSLWLPARWIANPWLAAFQWGVWLAAVLYLVRIARGAAGRRSEAVGLAPSGDAGTALAAH